MPRIDATAARALAACGLVFTLGCGGDAGSGAAGATSQAGAGGASAGVSGAPLGGTTTGGATSSGGTGGAGIGPGTGGAPAAGGSGGSAGSPSGGAGAGGLGGTSGASGAPNAGSGGGSPADRSPGCGMPTTDAKASFVRHTLDLSGTEREYFVYLPSSYDPARAYPVVFVFHGAGGTGRSNNVPIERSTGADAIVVGGTALINTAENRTQWQFNSATSPDVAFFDALVMAVGGAYCVDRSRLFAAGFSSGGWMCNLLGCVRPNVLRGYGVVAGGLPGGARSCSTEGIAAWFLHDLSDTENSISGNERARDRLLGVNGCGMTAVAVEPSPCVRYQGCAAGLPVDWCATSSGAGHSVQGSLSGPGMWRFFSSL